jgi:hypothetical protein
MSIVPKSGMKSPLIRDFSSQADAVPEMDLKNQKIPWNFDFHLRPSQQWV